MTLCLKYIEQHPELWYSESHANTLVLACLLQGSTIPGEDELDGELVKLLDDKKQLLVGQSKQILEILEDRLMRLQIDPTSQIKIRDLVFAKLFIDVYQQSSTQGEWHRCTNLWRILGKGPQEHVETWYRTQFTSNKTNNITVAKALIAIGGGKSLLKYFVLLPEHVVEAKSLGDYATVSQLVFESDRSILSNPDISTAGQQKSHLTWHQLDRELSFKGGLSILNYLTTNDMKNIDTDLLAVLMIPLKILLGIEQIDSERTAGLESSQIISLLERISQTLRIHN